MVSGSANVRYGMIRPVQVLNRPMSDHSLNSGAAMAICGNVEIVRTIASMMLLPPIRRRASAYAQNAPTMIEKNVVSNATAALLRSACVKSGFLKIDL